MSPRRMLVGTTVVLAVFLGVVSLAWACTPPTFGVPGTFALSRAEGPAGSALTARGERWQAGSTLEIRWDSEDGPLLAQPAGPGFAVPITIPSNAAVGTHHVLAVRAGSAPMTAPFVVTRPPDPPAGQPAAGQQSSPSAQQSPPAAGRGITTGANGRRAKAIATCKRRYSSRRARTASQRRRLAKRRAACIRRAKRRLPVSRTSSFTSPVSSLLG